MPLIRPAIPPQAKRLGATHSAANIKLVSYYFL